MNKNTIIGFLLMLVILFGFSWYTQKQTEEQLAIQRKNAPTEAVVASVNGGITSETPKSDTVIRPDMSESLGETLASALNGEKESYTLENDKMIIKLSNKGGMIKSVELKDFTTYEKGDLYLYKSKKSEFNLSFYTNQNINTNQFYFKVYNATANSITMRLYADTESYIEYAYALADGDNMVDFKINLHNMSKYISPVQTSMGVYWSNISPQQERGFKYENQYTTIGYKALGDDDVEELSMSEISENEVIEEKIEWVAFKQQFFSSILISKDGFTKSDLSFDTFKPGFGDIKQYKANLSLPYNTATSSYDLSFYFGPNDYDLMKKYDLNIQDLIPMGWSLIRWITVWLIIPMFNFLGGFISNYGLIIFLLTIIIKLLIFPFTYKSYVSMAKIRILKPEIDVINEKYPNKSDAMKKQQETMELYKRAGANPMGGCIPMLFQLPIILAMFNFFPSSIELRGQSFLWATDLSSYDSIYTLPFDIPFYGNHISLFALLMALSMYFSTRISMQNNATSNNALPGMNAMMLYVMPVMLLVWFNSYSSGLCFYYLLSNLITMGQTLAIRSFVSDEKLHAQMKQNAKKPVKKSSFQKRLEDMAKQQQNAKK